MKNYLPRSRKKDIAMQELFNEILIYDLKIDKAFCLNHTSALIWQACDGSNSITKIAQSVSQKLNTPVEEDLVRLALDNLRRKNLIDDLEKSVPFLDKMERRNLLKKIGLVSMIALPIISSLAIPHAAAAQRITCAQIGEVCSETMPFCSTSDNSATCFGNMSSTNDFRCIPFGVSA